MGDERGCGVAEGRVGLGRSWGARRAAFVWAYYFFNWARGGEACALYSPFNFLICECIKLPPGTICM